MCVYRSLSPCNFKCTGKPWLCRWWCSAHSECARVCCARPTSAAPPRRARARPPTAGSGLAQPPSAYRTATANPTYRNLQVSKIETEGLKIRPTTSRASRWLHFGLTWFFNNNKILRLSLNRFSWIIAHSNPLGLNNPGKDEISGPMTHFRRLPEVTVSQ